MTSITEFGPGCPWYEDFEKFGAPNVKWCEQRICALLNEPSNAWSNVAFLLVAVLVFKLALDLKKSGKSMRSALLFSGVIWVMGAFSFVFHATNNFFTQIFDFIGMYLFVFLILVMNLVRLGFIQKMLLLWHLAFVGLGTGALFWMRSAGLPYQFIIVGGALLIIVTEILAKRREKQAMGRDFYLAITFFLAGAACSALDVSRTFCIPESIIQGHAAWHLLSALGAYFTARHYVARTT
ncbi:MAG: ceramidase domain-containing protein [Bdellovibrionales bacterium]|nr:ceramidase domain-containing protein [Bdellovibrionales bacterium]